MKPYLQNITSAYMLFPIHLYLFVERLITENIRCCLFNFYITNYNFCGDEEITFSYLYKMK
jgi:hypothetical protein